jgi:hypothetical protein
MASTSSGASAVTRRLEPVSSRRRLIAGKDVSGRSQADDLGNMGELWRVQGSGVVSYSVGTDRGRGRRINRQPRREAAGRGASAPMARKASAAPPGRQLRDICLTPPVSAPGITENARFWPSEISGTARDATKSALIDLLMEAYLIPFPIRYRARNECRCGRIGIGVF